MKERETPLYYFKVIQETKLDIIALRGRISTLTKEINNIIDLCAPNDVKAISYEPPSSSGIKDDSIETLIKKKVLLEASELALKDKERLMRDLRSHGLEVSKKIDGIMLKVFIFAFIDGKRNEEIADELGYSKRTIENIKVKINHALDGIN